MEIIVKSRGALPEIAGLGAPLALVSISDFPDDFPEVPTCDCRTVLRLSFEDVEGDFDFFEDKPAARPFTAHQARQVAAFVRGLPAGVRTLVFQCEAGVSRSPAMAAAVSRFLGMDDLCFFRLHMPNRLVYRLVLEQITPLWDRASGDAACVCGKLFRAHPQHPAFPDLTALCDGRNVKL
jgi:predicted protein tyrosine phosphatase